MSKPRPPVKTALGLDELRSRAHGLNQRHRTMLLLVDGTRPLSEVLALGLQAGARTSHFEDLVRLGLVDVAIEADPVAPTPSQVGAIDAIDSGGIHTRSSAFAVEIDEPAAASAPGLEPARSAPRRPASAERADRSPRSPTATAVRSTEADDASTSVLRQRRALARADDEAVTQEVRGLLIDTLRIDAPLFAAMTLVRVRRAQTAKELINLVWEIERHLVSAPPQPAAMRSLYRARELLGMGNTQVSTDTPSDLTDTE